MYGKIYDYNRITGITPDYQFDKRRQNRNQKQKRSFEEVLNEEKGRSEDLSDRLNQINIKY